MTGLHPNPVASYSSAPSFTHQMRAPTTERSKVATVISLQTRYRFLTPSSSFGDWTNQTLKTAMGKSLDWYQEGWENNLKITETPPDVVEVVKPDQTALKDHLQA
ncbi:uncharacterized protein ACWYII_010127 isoform 1-T1 [Salvelinus alpinus]